jgi:uncharacterized protein (TIGR01777 family)
VRIDTFVHRSRIAALAADVFDWHLRPGAFERLAPPWDRIRLLDAGGGVAEGSRAEIEIMLGPFRQRWTAEHRDIEPGRQFRDVQVHGPFARWEHTHTITPDGPEACWLQDRIEYAAPFGAIGRSFGLPFIRRKLRATFAYRHRTTAADLCAHRHAAQAKLMKILVTGSTGLVGHALVPFLTTGGHSVTRLVRRAASPNAGQEPTVRWDPILGTIDQAGLEGHDAVVHLAGENISAGRWNDRQKKAIRDSRLHGTQLVCDALLKLRNPPKTLVCASAIGFYGDRGDEILDEKSPVGAGFLAEVCRDWEAATESVRLRGMRVVNLRFGVILSPAGGALQKMLLPFKLGLGGIIGSGRQYWSWIEIDDVVGAILHALTHDHLSGPVNAVSPNPATNRDFTKTLGQVLNRPTVFPLPAFAARLALGKMADDLLLASARVVPRRLEEAGYAFRYPQLEPALRHVLGR